MNARQVEMTIDQKRRILAGIIEDSTAKASDRLFAIELDCMLAGHFAPTRHLVELGPKTLRCIKELTANLVSALDRLIAK
jgi:hypothetical protein